MQKSVLIVAFYYPPYPKVGSRRWVKFAKYLNRHNTNIHVLAAQMDVDKKSPWDDDAKEIEHLTTRIHFKYRVPYYKRELPVSFFSKIKWQISKKLESDQKKALGNPSDGSERYAPDFLRAIEKIIQDKKITTIIFTASPNHLAYHISTLKEKYKSIKFIFDLRDYWSDWMKHLDVKALGYEEELERITILNSDIIISPAKRILDTLKEKYPQKKHQMKLISHAYDNDDFINITVNYDHKKNKDGIYLIYAGSMYENMEGNMKLLANLLHSNKNIFIKFYTFTEDYKSFFNHEAINKRVTYLKPLPIKEFTEKMNSEADALIYMRSTLDNDSNFLSSKFFDFLPSKKPIVYLGNKGDALDLIEKENLGFHLNTDTLANFKKLLSETKERIKRSDITKYSFDAVTHLLEAEIEN